MRTASTALTTAKRRDTYAEVLVGSGGCGGVGEFFVFADDRD
jgi:hypothetical protein